MKKTLVLLLLLPSLSYGNCRVANALSTLAPGAQWVVHDDTYAGIEWTDAVQVKPTPAQVVQAIADCRTVENARLSLKQQARLDVKNSLLTQVQRLQALLILLDYDQ